MVQEEAGGALHMVDCGDLPGASGTLKCKAAVALGLRWAQGKPSCPTGCTNTSCIHPTGAAFTRQEKRGPDTGEAYS